MIDYVVTEYPNSRVATFDVGKIGCRKHHIIGLIEADISIAKEKIKQNLLSGNEISLFSWIIKTISTTIAKNKYIHAVNYKKGKQVIFDNVDISIPIEREIDGIKVPLAAVIRNTNLKTITEIHNEIETFKRQNIKTEQDYVLGEKKRNKLNQLFFNLPQWIRLLIWKFLLIDPFTIKKNMGTVMITNVGMAGNISGWIIPKSIHNLSIGIGSICKKPWIHNKKIEIREIMNMTILIDHDVVDGLPAAKFTAKLVKNIEMALGL
jgi:pyruvate/2-oxoglutarate dehydrogenase complex dihydrolipoamide acyltransferase (E2) component